MVYRGSVSFILAARAEGELLDNNQVTQMMRLSLCMVWFSIFQHIILFYPTSSLMAFDVLTPTSSLQSLSETNNIDINNMMKDKPIQKSSLSFQYVKDWFFHKLVRNTYQELEIENSDENNQDITELNNNNNNIHNNS